MEAEIQHRGTPAQLPRIDVSALGPVGEKIDAARDLADQWGMTADIEKMLFSGMTARQVADALKDRLDLAKPPTETGPNNPRRENLYFVRQVRMSLGVPPVDHAGFQAWQAQAAERINAAGPVNAGTETAKTETAKPEPEIAEAAKAAPEIIVVDQATQDRLAERRSRDTAQVKEKLGLNAIEPALEKKPPTLDGGEEAKRAAWLGKADADKTQPKPPAATDKKASGNAVESDEIFTASQADIKPLVPQDIEKRYLRVGGTFYHPKNTDLVAFEDKGNKLETRSDSEQIAESMVRIAEARGWDEIKVSGSETFRREVWLEAASRGMQVKGYSPTEQDKAQLAKRASERPANDIEQGKDFRLSENKTDNEATVPRRNRADAKKSLDGAKGQGAANEQPPASPTAQTAKLDEPKPDAARPNTAKPEAPKPEAQKPEAARANAFRNQSPEEAVKAHPELAGAYATVAALDKKAEVDGLDQKQRAIVSALVREFVASNIERGKIPNTKLLDEQEVVRARSDEQDYSR
jgi:hypothetical protein